MVNAELIKEAINKNISNYQSGKKFPAMEDNPICALTEENGERNCYRCPLNVNASEVAGILGCATRKNKEVPYDNGNFANAIIFNIKTLAIIDKYPPRSFLYGKDTKSQFATAMRTLDLVL